jgi:U3 small nucleolar RNA-associated protein 10
MALVSSASHPLGRRKKFSSLKKMSSLQQQLEKLAPTSLFSAISKQRASLVWDAKQAADIDRETVFQVSLAALLELTKLDSAFGQFSQTLFAPAIIGQDRNLLVRREIVLILWQNAQENQKLDLSISLFFTCLSPHFLHAASFKACEWLVRRWKGLPPSVDRNIVNELNLEAIISCILPYHETTQFVKFVSILSIGCVFY